MHQHIVSADFHCQGLFLQQYLGLYRETTRDGVQIKLVEKQVYACVRPRIGIATTVFSDWEGLGESGAAAWEKEKRILEKYQKEVTQEVVEQSFEEYERLKKQDRALRAPDRLLVMRYLDRFESGPRDQAGYSRSMLALFPRDRRSHPQIA